MKKFIVTGLLISSLLFAGGCGNSQPIQEDEGLSEEIVDEIGDAFEKHHKKTTTPSLKSSTTKSTTNKSSSSKSKK